MQNADSADPRLKKHMHCQSRLEHDVIARLISDKPLTTIPCKRLFILKLATYIPFTNSIKIIGLGT